MKRYLLAALLCLTGCHRRTQCYAQQEEPVKIQLFAFAGQSNMASGETGILVSGDPRILYLTDPMRGPAATFMSTYIAMHPHRTIAGANYGQGGTPLLRWSPAGVGDLYFGMVQDLQKTLRDNPQMELAGLIFYQGECDANATCHEVPRSEHWDKDFGTMVTDFRATFGKQVPVVFAQLDRSPNDPPFDLFWDTVRDQQAMVNIGGVVMIKTDDQPTRDPVHLTDEAYEVVAHRMEGAYEAIVNPGCTEDDGWWFHF